MSSLITFVKFQDNCVPSQIIIYSPLTHRQKQLHVRDWGHEVLPSIHGQYLGYVLLHPTKTFTVDTHDLVTLSQILWYDRQNISYSSLVRQSCPASYLSEGLSYWPASEKGGVTLASIVVPMCPYEIQGCEDVIEARYKSCKDAIRLRSFPPPS